MRTKIFGAMVLFSLCAVPKAHADPLTLEYKSDIVESGNSLGKIDIVGIKLGMNRDDTIKAAREAGYRLKDYEYQEYCSSSYTSQQLKIDMCLTFDKYQKLLSDILFVSPDGDMKIYFEPVPNGIRSVQIVRTVRSSTKTKQEVQDFYYLVQSKYGEPTANAPMNTNVKYYCWAVRKMEIFQNLEQESCSRNSRFDADEVLELTTLNDNFQFILTNYKQSRFKLDPQDKSKTIDTLNLYLKDALDKYIYELPIKTDNKKPKL